MDDYLKQVREQEIHGYLRAAVQSSNSSANQVPQISVSGNTLTTIDVDFCMCGIQLKSYPFCE